MTDIKNIIIIGKVGSGKTTLANVLSKSDEFKEDDSSLTKSWRAVDKEFEENGIKYRVIDTVGLGNTKLSKEQLLEKFEEELGTYIDEGMSQVFLVIRGKLDKEVLTEFLWLNEYLFDNKALDFTAIVRTNFTDFRSKKRCEEDTKELTTFFNDKEIYEEINNKVLKKEKIIYVNNPLISFNDHSNHEKEIKANKNLRQKSRDKILEYLKNFDSVKFYKSDAGEWLDKGYPENERKEKVALNIGGKKLKGRLSVKGFSNLKGLNCSNNQFTSLDLSSCKDLIELRCNNNNFTNLNFLKQVANLEILEIKNNPNIPLQNLKILSKLTKLKELHITNIEFKNFDYLPANCEKLYCNNKKIIKELEKNKCLERDRQGKYYNLDQWRETNRQNKLTADVIPSERLFVIRNNLKQFLKKWGTKDNNGQTELSKLQNPQELNTYWYLGEGGQWLARGTAVTGGILAATVNPILGGVLAAVSPVVEISASQMKDKLYETKQQKWNEFLTDADNFLDNFNELLGTLKRIAGGELGEVNKKLDELNNKVKEFLQDYDKDGNREIDLDELINERMKFNKELDKIEAIERAIKALEKEVIKYKKGSIGEEKDEETKSTKSETQPTALEKKLAQRKKEREQLEQKKNELAVELKEIEIHCQQIKKELSQHQNDLLLLTDTDEEKGLLKEKIIDLKKELREVEQKNHDISQQLIKTNVVLFSQQIKNLNLGSKVNQSWTATCECAKNCVFRTKLYLTTPIYCWEEICEGKLSREMVENNNSKGKVKEAESQVKDEQYEEQIEVSPYQKK